MYTSFRKNKGYDREEKPKLRIPFSKKKPKLVFFILLKIENGIKY